MSDLEKYDNYFSSEATYYLKHFHYALNFIYNLPIIMSMNTFPRELKDMINEHLDYKELAAIFKKMDDPLYDKSFQNPDAYYPLVYSALSSLDHMLSLQYKQIKYYEQIWRIFHNSCIESLSPYQPKENDINVFLQKQNEAIRLLQQKIIEYYSNSHSVDLSFYSHKTKLKSDEHKFIASLAKQLWIAFSSSLLDENPEYFDNEFDIENNILNAIMCCIVLNDNSSEKIILDTRYNLITESPDYVSPSLYQHYTNILLNLWKDMPKEFNWASTEPGYTFWYNLYSDIGYTCDAYVYNHEDIRTQNMINNLSYANDLYGFEKES